MSGVATVVEAERIARAIACPTCQVEPGVMCIPTWPVLSDKPNPIRPGRQLVEHSHWRRMQAAVGGDDWWRKVVGAR